MRTDDCGNRPGAEPQLARRAGLLFDTDQTFIVDHQILIVTPDPLPHIPSGSRRLPYGIYLGDRTPEESGVWCLPELATAFSFISERITNDCN